MSLRITPFALASVLLLIVISRGVTDAHAVLIRASPSAAESLDRSPDRVQLLFSESIDPVFSNVHVIDSTGRAVDRGDSHVDPSNDHLLVASLQPDLPNGIYGVVWRSLSTIDVHPDGGQYSLYVGVPVQAQTTTQAALQGGQNTSTPETTLARWWFYLAASAFGGGLAGWKLVLAPAVSADEAATGRRRVRRFVVLGGVLLLLGTAFAAVAQAAAAADVSLVAGVGQPLLDLLGRGRYAAIWWPRFAIEVAAVVLITVGGVEGMASESALAMVPAILLTSSLTSHGAALPSRAGLGIGLDWLHVLGAATWIGGLAVLTVLVPSLSRESFTTVVRRFSRLALLSLIVVALSGAAQAAIEVGSWDALISSAYGRLVLVKIGLLAAMLVLAAVNTVARGRVLFVRGTRAELIAGIVVLAIAAMLTGTPPARNLAS